MKYLLDTLGSKDRCRTYNSAKRRSRVEVALAIPTISFAHTDPADQFLAATTKILDLTLITADEHLLKLSGIRTLASR